MYGATALFGDSASGVLQPPAARKVEQRNVGACFGQANRDALADAASGAGDKSDLIFERKHPHFRVSRSVCQVVASSMTDTRPAMSRSKIPRLRPRLKTITRWGQAEPLIEIGANHDRRHPWPGQFGDDLVDGQVGANVDAPRRFIKDDHLGFSKDAGATDEVEKAVPLSASAVAPLTVIVPTKSLGSAPFRRSTV